MANTFIFINKTILTGSQTSVTFSSIPSTYTDLKLVISGRTNRAATLDYAHVLPNGLSTNLSFRRLFAFGTTVASDTGTVLPSEANGANTTASTFSNVEYYIPNYTSSNNKSFSIDSVMEDNSASGNQMTLTAGLWSNTAAISSLVIQPGTGPNFVSGSSFYLYGISKS